MARSGARGARDRLAPMQYAARPGSARCEVQELATGKFHFEPPSCFTSLDHFVSASEQSRRDFKAERPGSRQIDREIEFCRLLDGNVGRFRPTQNLVDVVGGTPVQVHEVRSIGNQTPAFEQLATANYCRQSRSERKGEDAISIGGCKSVATDIECFHSVLERLESGRNILRAPNS